MYINIFLHNKSLGNILNIVYTLCIHTCIYNIVCSSKKLYTFYDHKLVQNNSNIGKKLAKNRIKLFKVDSKISRM